MVQFKFSSCVTFIIFSMIAIFSLNSISYAKDMQVTYENFAHAETSVQMDRYQKIAKGINKLNHFRVPTQYDAQSTIRMNRDTLYSFAVVNVKNGASIVMPDNGERYMSLMPVNEFGYTNKVWYGKGSHELTREIIGSDYALLLIRTLVDANDPKDVQVANDLQNAIQIKSNDDTDYTMPNWDKDSYTKIYDALIEMSTLLTSTAAGFGKKSEVDPITHVLCTASGFGGLPVEGSYYLYGKPKSPKANYQVTLKDVPVDGFWSFTIYDAAGYLFESKDGLSSINNITAKPSKDGSYTINFGNCAKVKENCLATKDGWNYIVRLYKPRPEIISGKWTLPELQEIK